MGYSEQFILLIPAKNKVIVATHNHDTAEGIESRKLPEILANRIKQK